MFRALGALAIVGAACSASPTPSTAWPDNAVGAGRAERADEPPRVVPPPGFRRGDDGLDDFFGAESDLAARVSVWGHQRDIGSLFVMSLVEVYRYQASPATDLTRWAHRIGVRVAGVEPDSSPTDLLGYFNYFSVWHDARGRPTAEWGWVTKGERVEVYDHLVADGDMTWHVRLSVHGRTDFRVPVGAWLARVFDRPFAGRAPAERRTLEREASPR